MNGDDSPTDSLPIAVIGAGYWGRKVIREILDVFQTTKQIKLAAVVDNSPLVLEQCQKEFRQVDYRLDYRSVLQDPDVPAVHVCTPNATHFEVAWAFLSRGKHVLLEKPLTLRAKEAYELVQLAKEKKTVLCAGHLHRFNNGVKELKRAMVSGVLGDIRYLRLEWTGFLPPQSQREVITDLAPHPFDICNYLIDRWPIKITCRGKGYRTKDAEVAFIGAEYGDGVYAQMEVSWLDHKKRRNVTVVGSEGVVQLDCSTQRAILRRGGKTEQVPITPSNTIRDEIAHFANCINYSKRSESFVNASDGMLGAHVVSLLEVARQSLQAERTVQVQMPYSEEVLAR